MDLKDAYLDQFNQHTMFDTYSEQVKDAADADGMLSLILAKQLMQDHSTSLYAMEQDGYKGHHLDAFALLEWLGY